MKKNAQTVTFRQAPEKKMRDKTHFIHELKPLL